MTNAETAKQLIRDAMKRTGGIYGLLTLLAEVVREDAGSSHEERKALAEKVARSIERARDAA